MHQLYTTQLLCMHVYVRTHIQKNTNGRGEYLNGGIDCHEDHQVIEKIISSKYLYYPFQSYIHKKNLKVKKFM